MYIAAAVAAAAVG
jgi:hypothetical protein